MPVQACLKPALAAAVTGVCSMQECQKVAGQRFDYTAVKELTKEHRMANYAEMSLKNVAAMAAKVMAEMPSKSLLQMPSKDLVDTAQGVAEIPSKGLKQMLPAQVLAAIPAKYAAQIPAKYAVQIPAKNVAEMPLKVTQIRSKGLAQMTARDSTEKLVKKHRMAKYAEMPSKNVVQMPSKNVAKIPANNLVQMSAKGLVQMPVQACLKPALAGAAVTGVYSMQDTTVLVPSSAKKLRTNMQRPKVLLQLPKLHLKLLLLVLYVLMGIVSGQSATELPRFCFLKSPTDCHGKWHEMIRKTGAANPFNGVGVGSRASPSFVDDDNDGDMDVYVGKKAGEIWYYKNTGSKTNSSSFTRQTGAANPLNGVDVGGWASPYFVEDDNDGGVSPITEAVLFPSVQEFECPASSFDASRWIASNTHASQELALCTLDVTNNGDSTNHGEVHLIDVLPQVGKEQGAYWCFIKEKEKRKVGEAAVHILGGINYSEANIICTGNCPRHATSRMEAVAASAVGEIRASYDSAKVVVKKSPSYHNLDESGQILRFEVYSLVVNVSWQQKEVPFLKSSLLESCVHVL
jgi:hypothetical protein